MKKSVKLGLKIAGLSVAWIPASIGALATIDVCTSLNSKAPLNKTFFRDSVKNKTAASKPITQLAMLGSHDALSNDITMNSSQDPYSPNTTALSTLARYIGPGALVRLSRAQFDDIYTQLNAGVRYVDARITCIDGKYYTHHTLISNTLEHYLNQILQWLDENPGEFIFFHIYYFNYDGLSLKNQEGKESEWEAARNNAWTNLYNYIASVKYNNKSLFDYDTTLAKTLKGERENCYFENLTYNDVTNNGDSAGAVIYFSSDDTSEAKDDEWCYKHIYHDGEKHIINPCAGTMQTNKVIAEVNNTIQTVKDKGDDKTKYLRYCQTQTTPNVDDVGPTIVAWSLLQKAHEHNAYMLRKSGIDWSDTFNYIPIYMCDFATDNTNGFCQEVIDKASAFNQAIK